MCSRSFFFPATAINFISIMGLFLSEFDFLFVFVKHLFLFLCNHAYISEIDLVLSVCVCVCVCVCGGNLMFLCLSFCVWDLDVYK